MLYSDMKAKFQARLNRRDCSDALADDFLQEAITDIQRTLRVPAMEKSVIVSLDTNTYFANDTSGNPNWGLPIPSDYLGIREMIFGAQGIDVPRRTLIKRDLSYVLPLADADTTGGQSTYYARQGNKWVLAPAPTQPYTDSNGVLQKASVRLNYYAEFPTSINPTDDTILTDIAWDLVLYTALVVACLHFKDQVRAQLFQGRLDKVTDDIQSLADDDELAGSAQVQPAYYFPED